MITPPYLQKGDKVGIVATANKINPEDLETGLEILKNWELQTILGKHLYKAQDQQAGKDEERTEDLQQMLDDTNIKAILFARGGYGTLRIIDKLDFSGFLKAPKWIAGYSDITVLHSHVNKLGVESIHSVMLAAFKADPAGVAVQTLKKALFGELTTYEFPQIQGLPVKTGHAKGELCGGNLSLLYALSGSASDLDTRKKILFIEDLDEYLYHIDRMIQQQKRAGKLKDLNGLIVGGMTELKDNPIPFGKSPEIIIEEAVRNYNFPVAMGIPAGHIKENHALIMGRTITLDINADFVKIDFNG